MKQARTHVGLFSASIGIVLLAACGESADEDGLAAMLAQLSAESPPPSVPLLLHEMAADPALAEDVLARADGAQRALTDSLLAFVALTEPLARVQMPELYVARDFGPPPDERPPAWHDLRWEGVRLLRRIAPDPQLGRDLRLLRDLEEREAQMRSRRPSEVAGLVLLLTEWWADRGDDPSLTHDASRIPDISDWLEGLRRRSAEAGAWEGVRMIADLDASPLRRRMLLDALSPATHAHLAAECVAMLHLDNVDLPGAGIEPRRWDPDVEQLVGHDVSDLWAVALAVLDRVTGQPSSGADVEAMVLDRLAWWRRARFEARYWRDPRDAPTLDTWLGPEVLLPPERGGPPVAGWVRAVYVAEGFRDLLLIQVDSRFSPLVSELVPLLAMDRDQAAAGGFDLAYRRLPLRARGPDDGIWVAIPWDAAQELVRELLRRVTDEAPPTALAAVAAAEDAWWARWWEAHAHEERWYRDPSGRADPRPGLDLEPERARIR